MKEKKRGNNVRMDASVLEEKEKRDGRVGVGTGVG